MTSKPAEESKVLYPGGIGCRHKGEPPYRSALARVAGKHQCGAVGGMGSTSLKDETLILG
jgi:hypothetical protein